LSYFNILASIQEEIAKELRLDPGLAALKTAIRKPDVVASQWRQDVAALVALHVKAKAEGLSEFAAAFLADPMTARRLEDDLITEAEQASWDMEAEPGAAERERLAAFRQALRPSGDAVPLAEMAALSGMAANEVELSAVTTILDAPARAAGIAGHMRGPDAAGNADELLRPVPAFRRQNRGRTCAAARDWAAWRKKAASGETASAGTPSAAAAAPAPPGAYDDPSGATGASSWLYVGAGVAVVLTLSVIGGVVLRRRRPAGP
jgi:hypothetical protein